MGFVVPTIEFGKSFLNAISALRLCLLHTVSCDTCNILWLHKWDLNVTPNRSAFLHLLGDRFGYDLTHCFVNLRSDWFWSRWRGWRSPEEWLGRQCRSFLLVPNLDGFVLSWSKWPLQRYISCFLDVSNSSVSSTKAQWRLNWVGRIISSFTQKIGINSLCPMTCGRAALFGLCCRLKVDRITNYNYGVSLYGFYKSYSEQL